MVPCIGEPSLHAGPVREIAEAARFPRALEADIS